MTRLKIFVGVLILIGAMLFLVSCGGDRPESEANARIRRAINDIEVRADDSSRTLGELRYSAERDFTSIEVIIDFARFVRDLYLNDFLDARDYLDDHIEALYFDIAMMYTRTNRLTVVERNFSALDRFRLPPDIMDMTEFTVNISRFLENHGQFLRLETQFGNLDIYSDFFFGRAGIAETQHNSSLRFSFDDEGPHSPEITIQILRQEEIDIYSVNPRDETRPRPINVVHPGQSSQLSIPLDSDFMRSPNNELLYNAVEFFDHDGRSHGVLPRSFIDDNYLHVFFNRTGQFRLINTPHGNTTNRADFLRDRGIVLQGTYYNGQIIVHRGEMYQALMGIHIAERSVFDIRNTVHFDDAHGLLALDLSVGRLLGVLEGVGGNLFRPELPLYRRDLFIMLAGNIEAFGFEIDGLKPSRYGLIGMPTRDDYWYSHMNQLINRRFVPYRTVFIEATDYEPARYVFDLAPDTPVTIEEAHEILFRLITLDIVEPIVR